MLASGCLVALLLSMPLATHIHWIRIDSRWGVTVGGFFLALECVVASFGSGKIIYRALVKQIT